MIRLFTVFCKVNFKNKLTAKDLFLDFMNEYTKDKIPFIKLACPACGAKRPKWSFHDTYPRYLIAYETQGTVEDTIEITRIACSSCKHTHAILPEIIIPYSPYSLLFILSVLKDYFSGMKVMDICEKYEINTSMLYKWKKLLLCHKKLWLGILEDLSHKELDFLSGIPNFNTSNSLHNFFLQNRYSFLQGKRRKAHYNTS